jgi:hypothetical protein
VAEAASPVGTSGCCAGAVPAWSAAARAAGPGVLSVAVVQRVHHRLLPSVAASSRCHGRRSSPARPSSSSMRGMAAQLAEMACWGQLQLLTPGRAAGAGAAAEAAAGAAAGSGAGSSCSVRVCRPRTTQLAAIGGQVHRSSGWVLAVGIL